MGSENSVLEDYNVGDVLPTGSAQNQNWALHHGKQIDGTPVSLFIYNRTVKKEVNNLRKAAKPLKALRHPCILKYLASGESAEGYFLVTEQASPLKMVLVTQSPLEVCAGLYSIIEALVFLHDVAGVCHNDVCLSSIYVTPDGSWRLGGLEHSCKFQEASMQFLNRCKPFRDPSYISPEEKDRSFSTTVDYGHCRDVYALGTVIQELLDSLKRLGEVTKQFEVIVAEKLLNSDPKKRVKLKTMIENRLFQNDFVQIVNFLKTLPIKSDNEKKVFFSDILQKLLQLPEDLTARRLTSLLLSRFVLGDPLAESEMVPHVPSPCRDVSRSTEVHSDAVTPLFTVPFYMKYVIPEITKILSVRDSYIRLIMMKYFHCYVDLFEYEILEDSILPHLLLGLRDSNDEIVSSSLTGLSAVVLILGGDAVIGGERKEYFKAGKPMGKILSPEKQHFHSGEVLGKSLLKDLAKLSISNGQTVISRETKVPNADKEAKAREREKRREEAKQRREERKRKQQERSPSHEQAVTTRSPISSIKSPKNDDMNTCNITVVSDEESREELTAQNVKPMKAAMSDYESQTCSFDGDISDEIESELDRMPSTVTSPRHLSYPREDIPKVDWSGIPERSGEKKSSVKSSSHQGALKLKNTAKTSIAHGNDQSSGLPVVALSKPSRQAPLREQNSITMKTDQNDSWGDSWDASTWGRETDKVVSPRLSLSPKVMESQDDRVNSGRSPGGKTAIEDLGLGYDVLSINVIKKNHLDFFADMSPKISLQKHHVVEAMKSPKSSSLNMNHPSVEATDGWGEELDWEPVIKPESAS